MSKRHWFRKSKETRKTAELRNIKLGEFSIVRGDNVVPANPEATAPFFKANEEETMWKELIEKLKKMFPSMTEDQASEIVKSLDGRVEKGIENGKTAEQIKKDVRTWVDTYISTSLTGPDAIIPAVPGTQKTEPDTDPAPAADATKAVVDEVKKALAPVNENINALADRVNGLEKASGEGAVAKGTVFSMEPERLWPDITKQVEEQLGLTPGQKLSKAAITTTGLSIALRHEEADRFIDYVVDQAPLLKLCRTDKMSDRTKDIQKLGIGTRVFYGGTEGAAVVDTVTATPEKVTLTAVEGVAAGKITYDSLEDNIEGDAFMDHLIRMITINAANEIEEAALAGDTTGSTGDLRDKLDGFYKQALAGSGHAYNTDNATDLRLWPATNATLATTILKSLPNKYRQNKSVLGWLQSPDIYEDFSSSLQGRSTGLGDNAITGIGELPLKGIKNVLCPMLPVDQAFTDYLSAAQTDGTFVMLTILQNLIVGYYRNITIETDRIIRERAMDLVISMRIANAIENTDAIAIAKNLKVQ